MSIADELTNNDLFGSGAPGPGERLSSMALTVDHLIETLGLTVHHLDDGTREVTGGYTGDLLSWVMGRATSGDAWVTIMSTINVIAVAQLTDVACVILAEGVVPGEDLIAAAEMRGINLLSSPEPSFALSGRIFKEL